MSQWVRKSHFQRKTRHLYALVFDNGWTGQSSVDTQSPLCA